jgi:hypothetical protein
MPTVFVDLVVALAVLAAPQPRRDLGELLIPAAVLVRGPADDQRGAGLVNEDRVDLVDDGEVVTALDALVEAPGHVVPEVVEAELVVGPVGDVSLVLLAALVRFHLGQDAADLQAKEMVHPPHPLGVTLGEVVVHRDDVHAPARQRVQVSGQYPDQRLALAGLHLGDIAHVQGGGAHQLRVEWPLAQGPLRRLADRCEGLGKKIVERLAVRVPLPELIRHRPQLGVA